MTTSPSVLVYTGSTAGGGRWSTAASSCSAPRSNWRAGAGIVLPDPTDPSLKTIRVAKRPD
jgi:hypothetical protein